ncbi:Slp family lipoprotein [Xenorhabdus cabanillasii]|uniref:Uncharacterized lipoprotein yeaY n=1 Tax=Xenorhabdus cabanillasii JM26 TaxID=1427517 RepID=W1J9S4_9GAMM|nr:Slp family lipoprotein [Xenorhabdus cabanillasii]PHM76387.1 membrane protein [Xenorhabdus cabanillasii JM26]CDL87492.1 Uncharacterized lipoprotein yeaY [Xenorhabdus cabanillasii JM26]
MLNGTHYRLILQSIVFIGAVILTGCVSVPDSIKGTTKNPVEDLLVVKKIPDSYIGHEGRFGGKVLSVLNEKGRTRLEISTLPLESDASPLIGKPSLGRLYAYVNSFLEPSDFQDHYVTVVGIITGLEKGKVGDSPYDYVVMNVNGFKRWDEFQRVSLSPSTNGILGYYGNSYFPGWKEVHQFYDFN